MNRPVLADESRSIAALLGAHRPLEEHFDEMAVAKGEIRPHWQKLAQFIAQHGRKELQTRWEQARHLLRDHGVTYNVYGDPQGTDRPWKLDPIPLLIPPEEWNHIEAGLTQRTQLFSLILQDLYGPQRLLKEGILPPGLIYANPQFLRPCQNIKVPHDNWLNLHASDLARSVNGQWWVLSDRSQAPSGMGYALENRIVLSRVFPEQFRDYQVRRLASFFRVLRNNLHALADGRQDNPNIVLLTPGAYNETYFEHAFLARYLGLSLVEGGDLTVRRRRVFIKTLAGLQPADVIFRRVDDTFCDPLELRGDSFLGVPGLVEATRAGSVAIANPLGAGLIESPAFFAFLPGLCRHLLGEDLKVHSVATWWCGQEKEREYVIANLARIVVKPAFCGRSHKPFFGNSMSAGERAGLIAAIRARPHEYVGQELVSVSTAPVWVDDRFEARPLILRGYVTASKDEFSVMPGGLARVAMASENPIVSMQSGGGSKDVWVLSNEPVSTAPLLSTTGAPAIASPWMGEVPSRIADHLFWLGRYAERLESFSRSVRCVLTRLADDAGPEGVVEAKAMAWVLTAQNLVPEKLLENSSHEGLEFEILNCVHAPGRVGAIREVLGRIRASAAVVRDRFSTDTWAVLNKLEISDPPETGPVPDTLTQLNTLIHNLGAFSGMEMENTIRGLGWRFLDCGRRIERAASITALLKAAIPRQDQTALVLEALLETLASLTNFRRRYFSAPQLSSVLEFLLAEETNPRGLAFQLAAMAGHTVHFPDDTLAGGGAFDKKHPETLLNVLRKERLWELAQAWEHGSADRLAGLLSQISAEIASISNELSRVYFTHTLVSVS